MSNFNKKSLAWKFFTDLGDVKASCNICGKVLSYRGGGPFNLTRHTKVKHPTEFSAKKQEQRRARADLESKDIKPIIIPRKPEKLSTLQPNTKVKKKYISKNFYVRKAESRYKTKPAKKPDDLDINLVKLITKQYLDLSIVESKEFKQFINELNPNYKIPSRKVLSNDLLTDCYNITKDRVKGLLEQAAYVSLTTDCWTSSTANESYVSVTAHFFDEKTEMKSCMLECYQFAEAQSLSLVLATICYDWGITEKIVAVTSNNDDNIREAIQLNNWPQITCLAQTINLAVRLALQEIEDTQVKIRSIVDIFQSSPTATETLQVMQVKLGENPQLKIKQGVVTRWSSTSELFEQVLSIKKSIMSTLNTHFPGEENISNDDIDIMTNASELLSYFKDFTEELNSENNVAISEVILISKGLIRQCEKFISKEKIPTCIRNMGESLLNELREHFQDIECDDIFAECTLLDPRFKNYGFSNDIAFQEAYSNLKALVLDDQLKFIKQDKDEDELLIPSNSKNSRTIWADFDERVNEVIKSSNPLAESVNVKNELDEYLGEALLPRTKSPFKWWNDKKVLYPKMYEIVKKRLCIIANSVPSELLFSETGQNIVERRNLLHGDRVPHIVFLNFNI